jgi:hypothetical protein
MTPVAKSELKPLTGKGEPGLPDRSTQQAALQRILRPGALAACFFCMVIAPFYLGQAGQPAGRVFTGTLKALGDESIYISAVRQGAGGIWLWRDQFMVHTPSPILSYFSYVLFGHLGAFLGISVLATYALMHGVAAVCLFTALWLLCSLYLEPKYRAWFVAFALGTSGLYWVDAILGTSGHEPASLPWMAMPPLGGLTSALMGAHETFGTAGQVMLLTGILAAMDSRFRRRRSAVAYGACGTLLVGLTLPMLLPVSVAAVGLCALRRIARAEKEPDSYRHIAAAIVRAFIIVAPAIPTAAYYYWQVTYGAWSSGNVAGVPGRPLVEGVLQWGVVLPAGAWGWYRARQASRPLADALGLWCCSALACMALPFWLGFRFSTGITTMAGGLVALGIFSCATAPRTRGRVLLAVSLGAATHYIFVVALLVSGQDTALYIPRERHDALQWLSANTSERDVVLAPLQFGNQLPETAECRLVAGHGFLTLDMPIRDPQLRAFYSPNTSPNQRAEVLRATSADIVVYDPTDTEDGTFDPRVMTGLQTVYAEGGVSIFRVKP